MTLCILTFSNKIETKSYSATKTNYLTEPSEMTVNDTIKFNLIGTDANNVTCSLKLSDITIIVGTTELSQSDLGDIKIGTINYPATNKATCLLTLSGVPGKGQLKIKIAGGTLTDAAGNTNTEATLDTVITMREKEASLTVNPNGGIVNITSPTGGTASEISSSTTYTQEAGTKLTYTKPTKASTYSESTLTTTFNYNGSGTANTTKTSTKTITYTNTFSSWTKSSPFNGTLSSTTGAGNYTYPSTDKATDTITANYTSGSSNSYTTITLPNPTWDGHTFDGWYTAATGGTLKGAGGATYKPTSSATLYAHWSPLITAAMVKSSPTTYYGKTVNYSGYSSSYSDGWQIFDSDGTNIYLLAKDYISYEQAPGSANYTLYPNSDYKLAMNNVCWDYSGTYQSDRCVAFMVDTNVWKTFKTGNADWATGGLTIQQFAASYQRTHSSKYIEYNKAGYGYQVKWNTDSSYANSISGLSTSEYSNLYVINSTSRAPAMWIASAGAYSDGAVMYVGYDGNVDYTGWYNTNTNSGTQPGFRPLVCLNSGVKLTNGSGTYDFDLSS